MKINNPPAQAGVAVLLLLILLAAGASYFLIHRLRWQQQQWLHYQYSWQALRQAREALISYAVNYQDVHHPGIYGVLPCPDLRAQGEIGNQEAVCGERHGNVVGRLPWQTLGIPPLRDGSGECLWYAVAGSWKGGSTRPLLLNADSPGMFLLQDAAGRLLHSPTAEQRPVAVVIAPGRVQRGQKRLQYDAATICGEDYRAEHYLDAVATIAHYAIGRQADQIDRLQVAVSPLAEENNDLFLPLFADDIFDLIYRRGDLSAQLYAAEDSHSLLPAITNCLLHWSEQTPWRVLPAPAPLSLAEYRQNDTYRDQVNTPLPLFGRLPLILGESRSVLRNRCLQQEEAAASCEVAENLMDFCVARWQTEAVVEKDIRRLLNLWQHWKDHLFYAVADRYAASDADKPACTDQCLRTAAGVDWAAILLFAERRLPALSQQRVAPPLARDNTKADWQNYLEQMLRRQDGELLIASPPGDQPGNDIRYCINDDNEDGVALWSVARCPR